MKIDSFFMWYLSCCQHWPWSREGMVLYLACTLFLIMQHLHAHTIVHQYNFIITFTIVIENSRNSFVSDLHFMFDAQERKRVPVG